MAMATVTKAKPKGAAGRGSGKLDINIDYVQLVTDEKVSLRAVKGRQRWNAYDRHDERLGCCGHTVFSRRAVVSVHESK
jgi:hypothetical protein